jgi:predicted nucleotidyltransferase
MSHLQNIARIKAVHTALEELAGDVVFIGGAAVSLYTDRPAADTRPTEDVDILVELLNYRDYAAIEEKLRQKGFINDVESGIICRYTINGIIVDVMPTSPAILGFANKWYAAAFAASKEITIGEGYTIRIFSTVYFLAAKLEAWKDRGDNDGRTSTDFEDIVFVLNNRNAIWQELAEADEPVKQYLKVECKKLLDEPYIEEWLSVHLDFQEQKRVNFIIGSLSEFIGS